MHVDRARSICMTLLVALFLPACAKCRPDLVAGGVARLTVANLGMVTDALNADESCGFSSAEVKAKRKESSSPGAMGRVEWTVHNCTLDLDRKPRSMKDCKDVVTTAHGKVGVSAKRTIEGLLTGDPEAPVIPGGPDAVTIELSSVRFDNFFAEREGLDARMYQMAGALSAKIRPRLAKSASVDICAVPTGNIEVSDIKYRDALVRIVAEGHDFEVEVPDSDYRAVIGKVAQEENMFEGWITVFGDKVIALPSDDPGFDPHYDANAYEDTYSCAADLALPPAYDCGDGRSVVAMALARLSIRTMGQIANVIGHDNRCGLMSSAALSAAQTSGSPGEIGEMKIRIDDCAIDLQPDTVVFTDCLGRSIKAGGRVIVSAVQTMRGKIIGIPFVPPIPVGDDPISIEIKQARFEDFLISDDFATTKMSSGSISGRLVPRLAKNQALPLCMEPTGIARLSDVAYSPSSHVQVSAQGRSFAAELEGSALTAVVGSWDGEANVLVGSIAFGGMSYGLPMSPRDTGLDPAFDPKTYEATWLCGAIDRRAPFSCPTP
jgi:hypothetical protein